MKYHTKPISAAIAKPLTDLLLPGDKTWHANGVYWGVYCDAVLVAYAGLSIPHKDCAYCNDAANLYSDVVYLSSAGVLPDHRGRGLQRKLIRVRLRWAKAHSFNWAVSDTVPSNPKSASNLIRCGFRPFWPSKDWRWRLPGACYWLRKLT